MTVEKGLWEHIKETVGDLWDCFKDDVVGFVAQTIKELVPSPIRKLSSWLGF